MGPRKGLKIQIFHFGSLQWNPKTKKHDIPDNQYVSSIGTDGYMGSFDLYSYGSGTDTDPISQFEGDSPREVLNMALHYMDQRSLTLEG